MAIGGYVKPFVSHQQELEIDIKACTTQEELDAIVIVYGNNDNATENPGGPDESGSTDETTNAEIKEDANEQQTS